MITVAQLLMIEVAAEASENRPELRCQVAMADIYKDAGVLPGALEIPSGNRDWARAEGHSLFIPWLDASEYFEPVTAAPGAALVDAALPGDLIGFRLGRILHHVSILLSGGRLVHVFGHHGVKIAPAIPTEWAKRVERVWRPVQQGGRRPTR